VPDISDELQGILGKPLVAVVGTTNRSGAPHAVPVWFNFDGEAIEIWADTGRAWVKNLQHDPRCSVTIAESDVPFGAVLIRGKAEVVTGDQKAVHAAARRIGARYIPAEDVDGYVQIWATLNAVVRVPAVAVTGWGRGY